MLTAAAALLVATACGHSILGEWMVLRHLPEQPRVPAFLGTDSRGILRATWHLPSILGLALAYILWRQPDRFIVQTIAVALFACALAVAARTRGKHLGWVAFLVTAALCWLGAAPP